MNENTNKTTRTSHSRSTDDVVQIIVILFIALLLISFIVFGIVMFIKIKKKKLDLSKKNLIITSMEQSKTSEKEEINTPKKVIFQKELF